MRMLTLALLAAALAVPVGALADRGSSEHGSATAVAKSRAAVKAKKLRVKAGRHHVVKRVIVVKRAVVDEREAKGRVVSLSPLTVGSLTCSVPADVSLAGFKIGDDVEITCDLLQGGFVLRRIEAEDDLVEARDDEREVQGRIASLSPLTVGTLACAVPAGVSLAGFQVGDLVEMTCDLVDGRWALRKLKLEDEEDDGAVSHSGPGRGDDDSGHHDDSASGHQGDHDNSGPGTGGHGDDSGSGSGSGGGHGDD